jgi:hypothetical protein
MPTIDFPDDELAAVTAAIRRVIEGDRYPHAPRLDPLRGAGAVRRGVEANPGPEGREDHVAIALAGASRAICWSSRRLGRQLAHAGSCCM